MDSTTKKIKITREKERAMFVSRQNVADFVLCMMSFFMGRVVVFGSVNPLGVAYSATFFLEGRNFYVAAFFALAGIMTKFSLAEAFPYMICLGTMCVLNALFYRRAPKPLVLWQSAGAGGLMAFSGILTAVLSGGYLYYILMAVLEGVLTFCMAFVIRKGMGVINGRTKRKTLSTEELISISIVAGGLVAGAADIYIGDVSLRYYLCSLIIMVMAYKGGMTMGAAAGLLLGLLLNVSGYETPAYVVVMAVSGMIAGGMKELAKQFIAAGFALGCVIMAFYMQPELIGIIFLFSILFAGITFILLPEKMIFNLSARINPALDNTDSYIEKLRELTTYRLRGFARSFNRLSKTFSGLSEKRTSLTQKDVSNLIDDAAARVCLSCARCDECWEENFYNTYQTVFSMLNACEKKGRIAEEDIPPEFRAVCENLPGFSDAVVRAFDLYKANLVWHNRIVESRELVSQQLGGVARIIDNLAADLDVEVHFKEDLERTVLAELNQNKIEVESVIVLENKLGKYEVNISHAPCYNKRFCVKDIIPAVSRALGRKMKQEYEDCLITREQGKTVCKINLVEEQQYRVTSAVARAVKEGGKESGDSYSFMELRNGQCLLALSDGMGSGKRAREESAAAIELLEEFVETGFDKDTSVKMINSVLLLKSAEETFSTLDICSIDLYTGEAEFMKIGASSTFLARGGEVSVIRSWSLPVGIVNNVDLDVSKKQLRNGDVIVMVTDGLLDIAHDDVDKESWLVDTIRSINAHNPQDIADHIVAEAKAKSRGTIGDDMTVLAARFWEKV